VQIIVTDVLGVRLSASLSVTRLNQAAHAVCVVHLLKPLANQFGLLLSLSVSYYVRWAAIQVFAVSVRSLLHGKMNCFFCDIECDLLGFLVDNHLALTSSFSQ